MSRRRRAPENSVGGRVEPGHDHRPDCDGKGTICFVVCEAGGNCEGSTPRTGNPRLTLIGILQAGDNVNHHYEPMEGPTGGNTHQPDPPAATTGAAPGGPSFL